MDRQSEPHGVIALFRDALEAGDRDLSENHAFGEALLLCGKVLRPWLRREIAKHTCRGEAPMDVDDLLSDAQMRALVTVRTFRGEAGEQAAQLVKSILHNLVRDEARRRRAQRRRAGASLSLERDSAAAHLAELLIDERADAEAVARREEALRKLRLAIRRLPPNELRVVRLRLRGETWQRIEDDYGRGARPLWRGALARLRRALGNRFGNQDDDSDDAHRVRSPPKPR